MLKPALAALAAALIALSPMCASAQSWDQSAQNWGQQNRGGNFLGMNLSRCMQTAAIGAVAGGVLGGATARQGNRLGQAVLIGALGGVGGYFVCRYLGNRDYNSINNGYLNALTANQPYQTSFVGERIGQNAFLNVAQPQALQQNPDCRVLSATLDIPGVGRQALPQETYCNVGGQWRAAWG